MIMALSAHLDQEMVTGLWGWIDELQGSPTSCTMAHARVMDLEVRINLHSVDLSIFGFCLKLIWYLIKE